MTDPTEPLASPTDPGASEAAADGLGYEAAGEPTPDDAAVADAGVAAAADDPAAAGATAADAVPIAAASAGTASGAVAASGSGAAGGSGGAGASASAGRAASAVTPGTDEAVAAATTPTAVRPALDDPPAPAETGQPAVSGQPASSDPVGWDVAYAAAPLPAPTATPPTPVPTVFRATATRQLTIPAAAAQPVLARAALVAGFTLQDQLLTSIRAQRGSKYSGAALKPDKLPISLAVTLTDTSGGAQITMALADRWPGVFNRGESVAAAFRQVFVSLLADFDAALAAIDPRAEFPEIECTIPAAVMGDGPTAIGRTIDRTNRRLEATPGVKRRPTPTGSVTLVIPDAFAELDWTELQAMMTAGVLIATRPGPLPDRLARDVARVVAALETAAPQAGAAPGEVRIPIDAAARPVMGFLDLQAQLRGKLPLRTLHVCTTCRLEKIVNPDFQRLQQKNRKMRILTSTIGGAISMHGISAFLLVGRLAHLKLLDPDFVCPRCQGMTAETSLITFCPKCGDRCDDAALRTCRKCSYDLRTEVTVTPLWTDGQPPALPVWAPLASDPAAWPAPYSTPAPGAYPAPYPTASPVAYPAAAPVGSPAGQPTAYPAAWPAPAGDLAAWPAPAGDPAAWPVQTPTNAPPATWPAPEPAAAAAAPTWPAPSPAASPAATAATNSWPQAPATEPQPAPASAPDAVVTPDAAAAKPVATPDPGSWPAPDPVTDRAAWPAPMVAPLNLPPPQPATHAATTLPQPAAQAGPPAAWHPDPHGRHEYRWWDGQVWSEHVSDRGVVATDPIA